MCKTKLKCKLFGHDYDLLKIGYGRWGNMKDGKINGKTCNMFYHWRCKKCGLTHCNRRFWRYT